MRQRRIRSLSGDAAKGDSDDKARRCLYLELNADACLLMEYAPRPTGAQPSCAFEIRKQRWLVSESPDLQMHRQEWLDTLPARRARSRQLNHTLRRSETWHETLRPLRGRTQMRYPILRHAPDETWLAARTRCQSDVDRPGSGRWKYEQVLR
jgi:hypothetical protein